MTVRSSLVSGRDEHWTELGLDWIRTMTNFVELGLPGLDCEARNQLGTLGGAKSFLIEAQVFKTVQLF